MTSQRPVATVLDVKSLSVRFGGLAAVDNVDLTVGAGQIVGLIGPNGAGKTTFIDAVTGFVRSTGTVELDGLEVSGLRAHLRARKGVARTWQAADLFDDLTVADNLEVARERLSVRGVFRDLVGRASATTRESASALDALGLDHLAMSLGSELSTGQRGLVGLARALTTSPRLVCMDEPAAGLDDTESRELTRILGEIVSSGVSILLIDHDMRFVMGTCDYVYVLDRGRVIGDGRPDVISRNQAVLSAYLGSAKERPATLAPIHGGELHSDEPSGSSPTPRTPNELVRTDNLVAGYGGVEVIQDLNISVREGEIVALSGPNGAGKTAALLTISGLLAPIDGIVSLFGMACRDESPTARSLMGLSHVPEDRSLFLQLTVEENLSLGTRVRSRSLEPVLELFPMLRPLLKRRAALLSGGEQQMLAIGRALISQPRLLMIDELSLGLAPQVVERLLESVRRIVHETHCGVLLVEQHVSLALEIADRGYVVAHGEVLMSGTAETLLANNGQLARSYLTGANPHNVDPGRTGGEPDTCVSIDKARIIDH